MTGPPHNVDKIMRWSWLWTSTYALLLAAMISTCTILFHGGTVDFDIAWQIYPQWNVYEVTVHFLSNNCAGDYEIYQEKYGTSLQS